MQIMQVIKQETVTIINHCREELPASVGGRLGLSQLYIIPGLDFIGLLCAFASAYHCSLMFYNVVVISGRQG